MEGRERINSLYELYVRNLRYFRIKYHWFTYEILIMWQRFAEYRIQDTFDIGRYLPTFCVSDVI